MVIVVMMAEVYSRPGILTTSRMLTAFSPTHIAIPVPEVSSGAGEILFVVPMSRFLVLVISVVLLHFWKLFVQH